MYKSLLVFSLLSVYYSNGQSNDDPKRTAEECLTSTGDSGQCTISSGCNIRLPGNIGFKGSCGREEEICCDINDLSVSQRKGCGWRNGDALRILSDNDRAQFAEFPWNVAVLQSMAVTASRSVLVYTCVGSIIHPQVVMTTAHRVYKENITLRVRAGEWDTNTTSEALPHQDRKVINVIVHENFNKARSNLFYDIALLILDKPFDIILNVNMICLPPPMERATSGTMCISSGWGKSSFDSKGKYQRVPKKVELPVIDIKTCQDNLRNTRLGPFFKLHQTFMCAGGIPNRDTCTGDGGSPLICPIPSQSGRYMANGMVAWGLGCGNSIPAVYTDVGFLREWVDTTMTTLGYDTNSYIF